jgi:hypothetical protein
MSESLPASIAFKCYAAELPGLPKETMGIVLTLEQTEFSDLFAHLADDVLRSSITACTAKGVVAAVFHSVERWRRFIQKYGRRTLTTEEVKGLIGELVLLARLITKFGPQTAVNAWKGPSGALRDFELPDYSVEVKAYESATGATIWINDPEQLDDDGIRPVYLSGVRLGASASYGYSLPEFVSELQLMLADRTDIRELFLDRLVDAGYVISTGQQYEKERYVVESVSLYRVDHEFPRISAKAIPAAIDKVIFSIRLSALAPWHCHVEQICGSSKVMWGVSE